MILSDGFMILLALLLHFSYGELTLVRMQDEVYCISNSSNKALTWIPTIERNKQVTYKEEVSMIPANENLEEFRDLNCDLMRDGGCPLADKFKGSWDIIDNANDGYGFITDHRWHSLPMFETTGQPTQMLPIPITSSEKGHIYMSILARNNAFLTVTDGVKGFQIKLDSYVKNGIRRSLSYCTQSQFPPYCYSDEIIKSYGAILNEGKQWINVKVMIEPKEYDIFITIDDAVWQIPYNSHSRRDYRIGQLKNVFIATANQQMGFWKFHQYRALRPIQRGTAFSVDFTTSNNPQLCVSILYHSGGDGYNQIAAKLTMNDVSSSNSEVFEDNLKAGGNWQEYRHVFQLNTNTHYQLILTPDRIYPIFAIGEIRVCREREIMVTKMKSEERDLTCSPLNEDTKIIERRSDINAEYQFSYQCLNGSFGENCDIPCSILGTESCKGLRVCSETACSCLPGYNGSICENECHGSYGVNCILSCHRCRNGLQCNFVTGACPDADCEDGYFPGRDALCFDECRPGIYGHNCKQKCSAYCPTAYQCNRIDGFCTRDRCNPADYEPPTCQYPQLVISYAPEKIMSGVNEIQLQIRMESIPEVARQSVGYVGIQYRLHQTGAEWQEGPKFAYIDAPNLITLSSLSPKMTYDVRAILYDHNGNGNTGDRVPILSSVTTLCRPAGKDGLEATPEKNIIKIKINSQRNSEDCVATDYQVTVRGTNINYQINLKDDLTGESGELDYSSVYDVVFAASDIVIETISVMTDTEQSSAHTVMGILLFLIFVLLASTIIFWLYQKRRAKPLDRQKLHRSLASNGSGGPTDMAMLERPPETPPRPSQKRTAVAPPQDQTVVSLVQPEMHTCRIRVPDLAEYVDTAVATGQLRVQHALFPRGQTQPWVEGKKQEHRGKNRYGNLVAYDHTRVILNPLPKQPHSHYINANFIDGYNTKGAYIATQGPKESTLGDFWRMIWQENVFTVVMLANVVENGKPKCEQYWPKIGATIEYGGIKIRTISEVEYLDFIQRELEATIGLKTRKITHLHYTTWPDHGVPRYPHSLAAFMRFVLDASSTLPILVHCSAGVGRTGTVVLVHACYRMAEVENAVDPLALMSKMRSQRPNMVDNPDQYEAVHHVLVELLNVVDTRIKLEQFSQKMRNLLENGEMVRQYLAICDACERDIEVGAEEALLWPREKNRFPNIVPGDGGRVVLNRTDGGDYINAVYVDSVMARASYIVTQLPLHNTLADFWLMAWQKASVIVVLNQPEPLQDKSTVELWREYEELRVSPSMSVSVKQNTSRKLFDLTTVELRNEETIQGTRKVGRREIPVLTLKGWPARQECPPRPEDVVQLWSEAERLRTDSASKFPIVVVCHDGATACGIFVAAAHAFEGLKAWKIIDIGRAMRYVRHNRPQFIRSVEQYDCLHRMVLAYLDMFDSYANFQ